MNNVITNIMGGIYGINGININIVNLGVNDIYTYLGSGVNGYDSSYDAVLYWSNLVPSENTPNILNQYYNSNKGLVLGGLSTSLRGVNLTSGAIITTYTNGK